MKYQNNRLGHRAHLQQPSPRYSFSSPSNPKEKQYYPDLESEVIDLTTALSKSEHEQRPSLRDNTEDVMEVECKAVETTGKSLLKHAFNGTQAQSGLFTPIRSPGEVSTATEDSRSDQSCITVMDQSPPQPQDQVLIDAVEYCKELAYEVMVANVDDAEIREGYLSLNRTPIKPAIADCAKRVYERANGRKSRRENDEEECDGPEERKKMTRLLGILSKA